MNSGPTSERVYDAIKHRLLQGAFRPGERLDAAILAPEVGSSITPVRDALNRLTGEGLIVTGTSEGFHAPQVDEPSLKDLYVWNLEVLSLALKAWPDRQADAALDTRGDENGERDRFGALALAIAARSPNVEHLREIRSLNDRLHTVRRLETFVVAIPGDEIEAMATAMAANDRLKLRGLLTRYHRVRIRHAAGLLRALYRA